MTTTKSLKKKINKRDIRLWQINKAMPAVKRLVKIYNLDIVSSCINRLKEHDKALRELTKKKQEVKSLEKDLKC